jgi:hypothetical protein
MSLIKVRPIVLNYNQPEEADKIHDKLAKDGFDKIIVVDNGSDLRPIPRSANFRLPWNVLSVGQNKLALLYAMDYFPADFYWLISTSTGLDDSLNYRHAFNECFELIDSSILEKLGIMSLAIRRGDNHPPPAFQEYPSILPFRSDFVICFWCTYLSPLISHTLLENCKNHNSAFFEKDAFRGWSVTQELIHELNYSDYLWLLNNRIYIDWFKNLGFKKSVGGESIEEYRSKNTFERDSIMCRKYGKRWRHELMNRYVERMMDALWPYPVLYYDAFDTYLDFLKLQDDGTFIKS